MSKRSRSEKAPRTTGRGAKQPTKSAPSPRRSSDGSPRSARGPHAELRPAPPREAPRTLEQVAVRFERGAEEQIGRGMIAFRGRVRSDGTRAGARGAARRATFYLTPAVLRAAEQAALDRGVTVTRVVDEALADHFAVESNYPREGAAE